MPDLDLALDIAVILFAIIGAALIIIDAKTGVLTGEDK